MIWRIAVATALLLWLASASEPLRSQSFGQHVQHKQVAEVSVPLLEYQTKIAPNAAKTRETPQDNQPAVQSTTASLIRYKTGPVPDPPRLYQYYSSLLL